MMSLIMTQRLFAMVLPEYIYPFYLKRVAGLKQNFQMEQRVGLKKNKTGYINSLSRNVIIKYASTCTGIPYLWGGKTVKGFDCSGYIKFTHKVFGINIRRYT